MRDCGMEDALPGQIDQEKAWSTRETTDPEDEPSIVQPNRLRRFYKKNQPL